MAQDLNTRIVVRLEDRTRTGVQSTRKGLDSVSGSFKRLTSHATAALSSLVLVGGAIETLRRGAAGAVRAYAAGSSPLARGTRCRLRRAPAPGRFIPARAGNTPI